MSICKSALLHRTLNLPSSIRTKQGSQRPGKSWKPWKMEKAFSRPGKIMEFLKKTKIMKNHGISKYLYGKITEKSFCAAHILCKSITLCGPLLELYCHTFIVRCFITPRVSGGCNSFGIVCLCVCLSVCPSVRLTISWPNEHTYRF